MLFCAWLTTGRRRAQDGRWYSMDVDFCSALERWEYPVVDAVRLEVRVSQICRDPQTDEFLFQGVMMVRSHRMTLPCRKPMAAAACRPSSPRSALCPLCSLSSLSELLFGWAQDWPDHSRLHYEFRRQSPLSYEDKEAAYMEALMTAQSQAALAANLEAMNG